MGLPAATRASSPPAATSSWPWPARTVADTTRAHRVLETSQPPAYYVDPADVDLDAARAEHPHHVLRVEGPGVATSTSWSATRWPRPRCGPTATPPRPSSAIRGHLAFYAQQLDCSVDGEAVVGNEGTFYGGWITSDVVGPFKGGAGTAHW